MPGGVELSEKLPDEIFQLVQSLKEHISQQKAYRDQKFDIESILEVGRETNDFNVTLQRVSMDSDNNLKLIKQLREDTTKLLRHSESSATYFSELADQLEAKMKDYGEQIKELKMSLGNISRSYNVDELFKWLKKQHETLGEVAAHIYMSHERILEVKSELDKLSNTNRNLPMNLTLQ